MTYDVLNKVSKAELILWIRDNIMLPNISDEEFIQEAKVKKLIAETDKLLEQNKALNKKLEEAKDNHFEFMRLWLESQKLNDKIHENYIKINSLQNIEQNQQP